MVVELFLLGCTGVVMFLHGANFFFHILTQHLAIRSLRYLLMRSKFRFLISQEKDQTFDYLQFVFKVQILGLMQKRFDLLQNLIFVGFEGLLNFFYYWGFTIFLVLTFCCNCLQFSGICWMVKEYERVEEMLSLQFSSMYIIVF